MVNKPCMREERNQAKQKQKRSEDNQIKLKKKKWQKDKIIRDIRTLFEQENNYNKSIAVDNFWNNNYIEY